MEALRKLCNEIQEKQDVILEAIKKDLGKSEEEAYLTEYLMTKKECKTILRHLNRWRKPKRVSTSLIHFYSKSHIISMLYGKVGVVVPWNYPFQLAMIPSVEALAGGNTLVLKMSSKTPHTFEVVRDLFGKVYGPEEVKVLGKDDKDRERFFQEPLDFLFFTGSSKTGKEMAIYGAKHGIPVVLELGGKSPAIVCPSADIKITAKRILWGKITNAGQTCVAPDYVLVHHRVRDTLVEEMNKALKDMLGDHPLENPDYSKIIDLKRWDHLVSLAKEEGIFSKDDVDRKRRKIAPTIFTTTKDSPFMKEEIFGPFLPVLTWKEKEDAIAIINDHQNPLALYLFTKNKEDEKRFFHTIPFGGGCINDCLTHLANHHLPFGGIGESGQGRYHGKRGFQTFTYEKACLKKSFWPDIPLRYPPFRNKKKWIEKL